MIMLVWQFRAYKAVVGLLFIVGALLLLAEVYGLGVFSFVFAFAGAIAHHFYVEKIVYRSHLKSLFILFYLLYITM